MTLRQAISLLVEEGVLERRVGSGTFVSSTRVQEKMRGQLVLRRLSNLRGKYLPVNSFLTEEPFQMSRRSQSWGLPNREYYPHGTGALR